MNRKLSSLVVSAVVAVCAANADAAGPREPLTFQNVGMYRGWDEYLISKESPYDYLIVPAAIMDDRFLGHEPAADGSPRPSWNDYLKQARANGKRIIADLGTNITIDGEEISFHSLYSMDEPIPLEKFLPLFDHFFEHVDEEELYAVTIGEENVFWGGQKERLTEVKEYLSAKYDVPIYQWWSPSSNGSIVGFTWPNIAADGWMLDEYHIQQPNIEMAMRMHTLLRKPVFQIIWAAPDMPSVPWDPRTFWDQFNACRKYNVPISFFAWYGRDDSQYSSTWGWEPNTSPRMKEVYEDYVLHATALAKRLPPVGEDEWDFMPAGQKQIILAPDEKTPDVALYHDQLEQERHIRFIEDATILGFRHLQWDSSPLQLKPGQAGVASATLRYVFAWPAETSSLDIELTGGLNGGKITDDVADIHGKPVQSAVLADGKARIAVEDLEALAGRCVVTIALSGKAERADDVLAEIATITVRAALDK